MIASVRVCPGQKPWQGLLAGWTHNPSVVGSSPTRPTHSKCWSECSDLRISRTSPVSTARRLCGCARQGAGICPGRALRRSGVWPIRPGPRRTWRRSAAAQARVPQVVGTPDERRGLLRGRQRRLAGLDPGTPAGDRGQFAAVILRASGWRSSRRRRGRIAWAPSSCLGRSFLGRVGRS
jgi:hypothetical protein